MLIIAGSARCLWHDLSLAPSGVPVMAVNFAGLHIVDRPVIHLAGLHPQTIGLIAKLRATLETKDAQPPSVHSLNMAEGVTHAHEWAKRQGGTSGLFAARLALRLGYSKVILAGIPMDQSGHFYLPPGQGYPIGVGGDQDAWIAVLPELYGHVLSCSGWTRTLLGGL